MVGLVPTIHLPASSGARGKVDPRDKPEDDTGIFCWCQNARVPSDIEGGLERALSRGVCLVSCRNSSRGDARVQ